MYLKSFSFWRWNFLYIYTCMNGRVFVMTEGEMCDHHAEPETKSSVKQAMETSWFPTSQDVLAVFICLQIFVCCVFGDSQGIILAHFMSKVELWLLDPIYAVFQARLEKSLSFAWQSPLSYCLIYSRTSTSSSGSCCPTLRTALILPPPHSPLQLLFVSRTDKKKRIWNQGGFYFNCKSIPQQ